MSPHLEFRSLADLKKQVVQDDGEQTATSVEQHTVEVSCLRLFEKSLASLSSGKDDHDLLADATPLLNREKTVNFLRKSLVNLGEMYSSLDASRPWLVYWILHSLELLGDKMIYQDVIRRQIANFLGLCQNPDGGFGGGPGQMSHLAPTYAAVNALCILGHEESFEVIDRTNLAKFISKLRLDDGSFLMHEDGEVDIRGAYCALSTARLANVFTPEMFENTDQWIIKCQTYEGGFGGAPGMEAHGGYTFCGLAGLVLLGKEKLCNVDRLIRWTVNRQMRLEGGFQGRTNKLVDGCYAFWQGGVFPLLHKLLEEDGCTSLPKTHWLFDQRSMQEYLLICCQDARGGLLDKPGKSRDLYHTCYTLSGLSVAQNFNWKDQQKNAMVLGPKDVNKLEETHPLYNIGLDSAYKASQFFNSLPVPSI